MSEEIDTTYDSWDDTLDEDRKSGRKSSGKKFGFMWRITEAPTKIHFSRPAQPYKHPKSGKGFPFRTGSRHFIPGGGKGKKGDFIECGTIRGEPCVVCAYANPVAFGLEGVAPDARFKKLEPKLYYSVSGWIEEDFHLVDFENQSGDGGTHKKRIRCEGRGCELCKEGWPQVFGNRMFLDVSPGQWRHAFHDLHKRIENSSCKCGGAIYVTHFSCANAECDKLVLDVCASCDCGKGEVSIDVEAGKATCSGCQKEWSAFYTDHQKLYEESNESYECRCGHKGFLKPNRICSTQDCPVDPYGIFDCQLTVRKTGADKDTRIVIDEFVIQEPDIRLFDPAFQGGEGDEMAPKVAEANGKPLDLDRLLAPEPTEDQARKLSKPDPFNAVAAQTGRFSRYKGGKGGEEVAEEGTADAEVTE